VADQSDQHHQAGVGQTTQVSGTVPGKLPEAQQPEKKSRRGVIILVVLLLVLVAGFFYWRSTFTEDTDDAQVDGDLYQVSARVAGYVTKVYVTDNQVVHKGDPIADVDVKDFDVALEQAQANLSDAKAQYEQATVNVPITGVNVRTTNETSSSDVVNNQAAVSAAEASAAAAHARIAEAQANALKAKTDVDRYTPLVQRDVISKQQYDQAVAQAAAAEATVEADIRSAKSSDDQVAVARAKLVQAQANERQSRQNGPKQVEVQRARAESALAAVKQNEARVEQAKLNASYTHIIAPIDGIVSKKNVAVGANLSVGQALLTIVPLKNLWVTANFKETQLKSVQKDQEVDIHVDALGGRKFTGCITEVGGATGSRLSLFPPENATGNYVKVVQRIPVRIDFTDLDHENKDEALRPGMSVEPDVRIKDGRKCGTRSNETASNQ
jgi:membrane fusion protein, multidrug efflux system